MGFDPNAFITEKVREISETVGDGIAINALSGGVDSSVVTLLAHRALGDRLKSYFIDSGRLTAWILIYPKNLSKDLTTRAGSSRFQEQSTGVK